MVKYVQSMEIVVAIEQFCLFWGPSDGVEIIITRTWTRINAS